MKTRRRKKLTLNISNNNMSVDDNKITINNDKSNDDSKMRISDNNINNNNKSNNDKTKMTNDKKHYKKDIISSSPNTRLCHDNAEDVMVTVHKLIGEPTSNTIKDHIYPRDMLEYALDNIKEGYFDWDLITNFEYISPRLWEMFGYLPEEKKHHPSEWMDIIDPESKDRALKAFHDHVTSQGKIPYKLEVKYKHKKGHDVWVICAGKVVEWADDGITPLRMIGTHTDITEEKLAEEKKIRDLELNSKLKTEFLSTMSHEIRTPLNGLIGLIDLMRDTELSPTQQNYIKHLDNCANNLLVILNNILDINKIDNKKLEIFPTAINVKDLIDEITSISTGFLQKSNNTLKIEIHENVPAILILDAIRIKQIMNNLMNNACKFCTNGTITIGVEYKKGKPFTPDTKVKRINIPTPNINNTSTSSTALLTDAMANTSTLNKINNTKNNQEEHKIKYAKSVNKNRSKKVNKIINANNTKKQNNIIIFSVKDTGKGITPEQITRLFKPYVQLTHSNIGTGLGLSLCKLLAEAMGGNMRAESQLHNYTKISATLPTTPGTITPPISKRDILFDEKTIAGIKVLIVEDNAVNRKILIKWLTTFQCRIDTAVNGKIAVDKIANMNIYDVILMDVQMPVMNGLKATKLIRAMDNIPRQPKIIALTADITTSNKEKCMKAGADYFLGKPVRKPELKKALLYMHAIRSS